LDHWYPIAAIAFLFIADARTVSAKCGPPQPIRAVSASKVFGLNVDFKLGNPFDVTRKGEIIASGPLDIAGHHVTGIIPDSGAFFVIHDKYEGLTIYQGTGQILKRFSARQLLSIREMRTRPGKWACHPEGEWSSAVFVGTDGGTVVVHTHTGRQIVIDLASAEVVEEDHDWLQVTILAGASGILAGGLLWWIWRRRAEAKVPSKSSSGDLIL